jgi:hypothetical protein
MAAAGTPLADCLPNLAFASRSKGATCHFGTGNAAVSTALVPLFLSHSSTFPNGDVGRPRADFLAQLIATVAQAPQTRVRRRAEPAEAVAAYEAIEQQAAARPSALSRSL